MRAVDVTRVLTVLAAVAGLHYSPQGSGTVRAGDIPVSVCTPAVDGSLDLGTVTFSYDNRSRLIHEYRLTGNAPDMYHDLSYQYDQGGNRTRKVDSYNNVEVIYHYDTEQPCKYGTDNNRLVYYETLASVGGPVDSTSYYYYNCSGNVTRIITNASGSNDYSATRFVYGKNEQTVTYVMGETWNDLDPSGTYDIGYAKEFRYDGARQRYLNRDLALVKLMLPIPEFESIADTWSDYDGNDIYGDFDSVGVNMMSYEPGIARITDPIVSPTVDYYHANHLGTTRTTTDDVGGFTQVRAKTAFGEPLTGPHDRFGYAGVWGYQTHTEFPQLHVGARYYDPASGRFLQRDPIGIRGGRNVYAYVRNGPTVGVDPEGEFILIAIVSGIAAGVKAATAYYNYRAAQDAADAARPYNDGSNESTQRYLESRKDALRLREQITYTSPLVYADER